MSTRVELHGMIFQSDTYCKKGFSMVRVNEFGQIVRRSTFPTVLSVADPPPSTQDRAKSPPVKADPPARPPSPPHTVVGTVVLPTSLYASRDDNEAVSTVDAGRYELSYPMVAWDDSVRMRSKIVDEHTGDVSFQWMQVFSEKDGRRTRFVTFASA